MWKQKCFCIIHWNVTFPAKLNRVPNKYAYKSEPKNCFDVSSNACKILLENTRIHTPNWVRQCILSDNKVKNSLLHLNQVRNLCTYKTNVFSTTRVKALQSEKINSQLLAKQRLSQRDNETIMLFFDNHHRHIIAVVWKNNNWAGRQPFSHVRLNRLQIDYRYRYAFTAH